VGSEEKDLEAIRACLSGEADGRDAFAGRFRGFVASVVRRTVSRRGRGLGPAELEDLCQETFLALFENGCRRLEQYRSELGRPSAWVAMVARQVTLKRLEREGPAAAPLPDTLEGEGSPAEAAALGEDVRHLSEALKSLPPREALCLALLIGEDLPAPRVAALLGVQRQSVYEIRDRALARLRQILGVNAPDRSGHAG
jgi:RNA polymerase sigma factor (sigma-70 family)